MKIRCRFVSSSQLKDIFCVFILLYNLFNLQDIQAGAYQPHRCTDRLEAALKNIRRRSTLAQTSRLLSDSSTPYTIYQSIYGAPIDDNEQLFEPDRSIYAKNFNRGTVKPVKRFHSHSADSRYPDYNHKRPSEASGLKVEVEDLRVKLPKSVSSRWVEVDKCKFSTENSTLDTRLIFPDLTISGRVILQPTGEKCSLILRLRRAGIEFRTTPIGFESFGNEPSRRIGSASVRTDSHFAEPGFISVFAHSCQLTSGKQLNRRNSKRQFSHLSKTGSIPNVLLSDLYSSTPEVFMSAGYPRKRGELYNMPFDIRAEVTEVNNEKPYAEAYSLYHRNHQDPFESSEPNTAAAAHRKELRYRSGRSIQNTMIRNSATDQIDFHDDVFNIGTELQQFIQPEARSFAEVFTTKEGPSPEADEVLTKDMENFFSMGVKGLLTTYMQKSLQPAIKETLMENMGYTLSYG